MGWRRCAWWVLAVALAGLLLAEAFRRPEPARPRGVGDAVEAPQGSPSPVPAAPGPAHHPAPSEGELRVHVGGVGPDGPVRGAAVVVIDADGGRHEASCGTGGTVGFRRVPYGPFGVEAFLGHDLRGRAAGDLTRHGWGAVDVELGAYRTVRGRVLDAVRGEPVVGALVDPAWPPDGEFVGLLWRDRPSGPPRPSPLAVATDADGRYELWLSPASAPLVVVAAGHVRARVVAPRGGPGGEATVPDVRLAPAGALGGHVLGTDGEPLPGAIVCVRPRRPERAGADDDGLDGALEATTDEQGAWLVAHVPLDVECLVTAEADGWAPAGGWSGAGPTARQPMRHATLRLQRVASIHLVLRTPDGHGVPDATVHARSGDRERQARADRLGRVDLDGLEPGHWIVTPFPPEVQAPVIRIDLAPGQHVTRTVVALETGALEGVLRDVTGAPRAAARLAAVRAGLDAQVLASTDPDGRFRFPRLAVGAWSLHPVLADGEPLTREAWPVVVPARDVVLHTDAEATLVLAFQPPAGATRPRRVHLRELGPDGAAWPLRAGVRQDDEDGQWRHAFRLLVGEVDLEVFVDGFAPLTCRAALRAGETTVLDLPLAPGVEVSGRALDGRAQPLPEVEVLLVTPPLPRSVRSDAAGCFTLRALPPGELVLALRAPGRPLVHVAWEGAAGVRDIVLPVGARLVGVLEDEGGAPAAGRRIGTASLDHPGAHWRDATTTTDARGRFHLHVLPGRYTLVSWGPDGQDVVDLGALDLRDEEMRRATFRLPVR